MLTGPCSSIGTWHVHFDHVVFVGVCLMFWVNQISSLRLVKNKFLFQINFANWDWLLFEINFLIWISLRFEPVLKPKKKKHKKRISNECSSSAGIDKVVKPLKNLIIFYVWLIIVIAYICVDECIDHEHSNNLYRASTSGSRYGLINYSTQMGPTRGPFLN